MTLNSDGSVDMFIRALASYARIEGMKADNKIREIQYNDAPLYGSTHFNEEADYLEMLWRR